MKKAELVFIPSPGIGHLVSTVEMAKLMIERDERLSITVLIMKLPLDSKVSSYAKSAADGTSQSQSRIGFVDLPAGGYHLDSELSSNPMAFLSALVDSHKTHVRDAVTHIITRSVGRLAGLVVDMFCTSMIDVANEFGVPSYVFFTSSAAFLGLMFHLQSLQDDQKQDITDFKDSALEAKLFVPSFSNPVPAKVLPSVVLDKEGGGCAMFLANARRFRETKGIMINTFAELESHAIKSLSASASASAAADGTTTPPVHPVGPILSMIKEEGDANAMMIMRWLDYQPPSSVVFLCFGSMGSFSEEQVKEIARALESSGHRFLWSLRRPPPKGSKIELPQDYSNPEEVLPEGFSERMGKVIGWAPQVAVLSHPAVGGFVSHCGWNSMLESIWCGVPVATWPLYAEQQMNAFQMVRELGMAVEIKLEYRRDFYGVIRAEEIESAIRKVMMMNGDAGEIRNKVKEMKEKSRVAMMEGGSSYTSLGRMIEDVIAAHSHSNSTPLTI